jgi:hypothetical protein
MSNRTSRRQLGKLTSLAGLAVLGGCAAVGSLVSSADKSVTVTLAGAQAEAQAVFNYLNTLYQETAQTLPAAAGTAIAAAQTAVNAFVSLTTGEPWEDIALEAVKALSGVISLVPISSTAMLFVNAGIGFVTALLNTISTFTFTQPPSAATSTSATTVSAPSGAAFNVGAASGAVFPPIPMPVL